MTDHDYPYIEERDGVLYVLGSRVPYARLRERFNAARARRRTTLQTTLS